MVAPAQINALDPNALGDLKRIARAGDSPEGLRAAAKQFEALFMQMVLKSMREAMPSNSMFDNDQTRLFQSLQDQQLVTNLAQGRGIGLADVIYRQLGGEALEKAAGSPADSADGVDAGLDVSRVPRRPAIPAAPVLPAASSAARSAGLELDTELTRMAESGGASGGAGMSNRAVPDGARDFVNRLWRHAGEASRSTGIPAHFMVAQAALETGWGKGELRRADGSPSYNLFNIKAGANWKGEVVEVPVTEYANGRPYTETARFRAYRSYGEAFRDYAGLLRDNPRYAEVLGQTDAAGFARSLQQAGYATDPMYADKLTRIIGGNTLRTALAG